jgi:hypothetical protein
VVPTENQPSSKLKGISLGWLTRFRLPPRIRLLLMILVIGAFVIQAFRVFLDAYPIMTSGAISGNSSTLDFGSYYNSAWRLFHNPGQLYTPHAVTGDYNLSLPTDFKYLPFFTLFVAPLLALPYVSALVAWNIFQFLLMPIIGLLLYKALRNFNIVVIVAVIWIALLQPLPFPPHYTLSIYSLYHSQSYYWQWVEGQAKVLTSFLVVAGY